jgi:preprotein translocase subunit SecD
MHRFRGPLLALAAVAALLTGCSAAGAADASVPGKPLQLRLVISSTHERCNAPKLTSTGPARACDTARTNTYKVARSLGEITPTSVALISAEKGPDTVELEFDRADAKTLERASRRAIGTQLAIVLDGRVFSAPQVMDAISSREVSLGFGSTRQAKRAAARLRASDAG